jgi:hypothetical protein
MNVNERHKNCSIESNFSCTTKIDFAGSCDNIATSGARDQIPKYSGAVATEDRKPPGGCWLRST